jgi:hypothetical protein
MSKKRRTSRPAAIRRRQRLAASLPDLEHLLRGSLVTRYRRCGRANCHCAQAGDPGHGPAYYLMVTTGPGKTVEVYVPREHKAAVEEWLANFKQVREAMEQISSINRSLLRERRLFEEE